MDEIKFSFKAFQEQKLLGVVRCGWISSGIFTLDWGQKVFIIFESQISSMIPKVSRGTCDSQ